MPAPACPVPSIGFTRRYDTRKSLASGHVQVSHARHTAPSRGAPLSPVEKTGLFSTGRKSSARALSKDPRRRRPSLVRLSPTAHRRSSLRDAGMPRPSRPRPGLRRGGGSGLHQRRPNRRLTPPYGRQFRAVNPATMPALSRESDRRMPARPTTSHADARASARRHANSGVSLLGPVVSESPVADRGVGECGSRDQPEEKERS